MTIAINPQNIKPIDRDLSLADYIGASLARDTLSSERRILFERMRSHLNPAALARCNAAYHEAVQS